jgi:hypothetical protein
MARIKITDLSKDKKISGEEMKAIMGGNYYQGMYQRQDQKQSLLRNPWLIGACIATAIVTPLPLDDDEDDEP